MSDPTITADEARFTEIMRFEEEADRIFGEDSRAIRQIIGVAIYDLRERAGPEATRTYLQKALEHIRKVDLLDTPPPPNRRS